MQKRTTKPHKKAPPVDSGQAFDQYLVEALELLREVLEPDESNTARLCLGSHWIQRAGALQDLTRFTKESKVKP